MSVARRKEIYYYFGMIVITLVIITVRLFKLGSVPDMLNIDEAGLMYNVKSLIKYGVDINLDSWSIYPSNFGSGQSALYSYLAVIICSVFGVSQYTIRIPAVIFSIITYIFGLLIIKEIYNDSKKMKLLYALLFMTTPYFFLSARIALDCNLMLGMSTIVLWCCIKIIKSNQSKYYLILGISGGITLYSYALSHIILPLFFVFMLIWLIKNKKITWKKFLLTFIPVAVLAIPLVLFHVVNLFEMDSIKLGIITIPVMENYRIADFQSAESTLVKRVTEFLCCIFFEDGLKFSGYYPYYTFFFFSVPLLLIGLCKIISDLVKKRNQYNYVIVSFVVSIIITILSIKDRAGCNSSRMNAIYFCLLYFIIEGILFVVRNKLTVKKILCIGAIYIVCYIIFIGNYFVKDYKMVESSRLFATTYPNILEYLEKNNINNYSISIKGTQVFYLLTKDVSPYNINEEEKYVISDSELSFSEIFEYKENTIYVLKGEETEILELLQKKGYEYKIIDSYYVCVPAN